MRIVFLNPSGELGGAETALLEILAGLRAARPAWNLALTASAAGPLLSRAADLGVQSTELRFPPSLARLGEWRSTRATFGRVRFGAELLGAAVPTTFYVARLRKQLLEGRPDVVHTNGMKMHLLGARAMPSRAHLVWHIHDYPAARPLSSRLLVRHASRCAAIVANSESVAVETRALIGPAPSVHAIYNAVDLGRFHPEGPQLDLDALSGLQPFASEGIRIGLVATFARWKGHEVFLNALSRVRSSIPVRGYVIGGPIYQTSGSQYSATELRALAASRGLGDRVGFTGRVDDVPAALRALDVVVHASVEPEPFGLVVAEAMACGRPLVVSGAGGAAEIAHGVALLYAPGSDSELAVRLSQLIENPGLRASMRAAGRRAAEACFDPTHVVERLAAVYESVVRSPESKVQSPES